MKTMFTSKMNGSVKKLLAWVMTVVMVIGILPLSSITASAEDSRDTISEWKYTAAIPGGLPAAATGGENSEATLDIVGAKSTGAYSSNSITSSGWNATEAYWLLSNVSTAGYKDLTFTAQMRSSGTGPKDFQMEYQIQGTEDWVKVADSDIVVTSGTLSQKYNGLPLPAELNDCESVNLRIIKTSNTPSSSGTEVQSAGTSNINNIVISGTEIDQSTCSVVNANPNSEEVTLGQEITLSTKTSGATIYYSFDEEEFQEYNSAKKPVLTKLPVTLRTYARKDGREDSHISTYAYTQKKVLPVSASPNGGAITPNTKITLTCDTEDAVIEYSLDGENWTPYDAAVKLVLRDNLTDSGETVILVRATKTGYLDSEELILSYTKDPYSESIWADEIKTTDDAISITDALKTEDGTEVTVVGQVVFIYGSNNTDGTRRMDTAIIEDVVDGQIVALQIFDTDFAQNAKIGDVMAVNGKLATVNGIKQIGDATTGTFLKSTDPISAQQTTITKLMEEGDEALSRYVVIKNVTLGTYDPDNTVITDKNGATMNIYSSAAFPDGVAVGDTVDIYAAFSKGDEGNWQLRNGSSSDIVKKKPLTYEEGITVPVAKWAGAPTTAYTKTTIYGDLLVSCDQLDTDSKLTAVRKGQNIIPTVTGGTAGYQGASGLGTVEGDYYQLEVSSEKRGNLLLSFRMYSSATAPKSFTVKYSGDGVDFTEVGNITISKASTNETFEVRFPKGADNLETLYIRLYAGTTSMNGDTPTSGNNRFHDVSITGNPVISDDICRVAKANPGNGEVMAGQEITLTSETEGAAIYYSLNGTDFIEYTEDTKPVISEFPTTLTTYAVKKGLIDSLKIAYNYAQIQVLPVKASPNGGAVAEDSKITLTCKTEDAEIKYSFDNGLTWQNYNSVNKVTLSNLSETMATVVMVKAAKERYKDSETTTLSFTKRQNEKYNLYYGQLHSHTEYSDGSGTAEQAYTYASSSERKNIDFLALTDHSNSFDGISTANIHKAPDSKAWAEGRALAKQYTTDKFVGLFGYEMTWSNGLGHMNTYNTGGFQSRTQTAFTSYSSSLQNYYAKLKEDTSSLSQFNHPGTTFGDFSDFAHHDEEIDSVITLIEVGNGEGAIGSSGYFPSYEYYTRALDKGWHVAPTNNQDNHKGRWGDANTGRTVILADTLTQDNVYDAIRNMRVFATEDDDLEIYYTLDGYEMGSMLDEDTVGDTVNLKVELNDPTDSSMGKVQVIVNGGLVLAEKTLSNPAETIEFELTSDYSYYYIKVIQADGDIAVTAPVWVGEVEAVGINSLTTDTVLPVTGEELDVTLEMYNNEKSDLEIQEVKFTIDGKEIHKVELSESNFNIVKSMGTNSYTFPYLNEGKAGTQSIEVTVSATLDGVSKIYKGILQLNYIIPDMITKIVIDGTHNNDYVTGYYAGQMDKFTAIAAAKYAKVHIETEKVTAAMLSDCDLLIVTTPATNTHSDWPSSKPTTFDNDFIETVGNYAKSGGTVIVCGIADYRDTAQYQTSTEANKLLEAMGATIKMNKDQAYDQEKHGNVKYRLFFTDFKMDSPYLANVVETIGDVKGQTYSAYSGCTVDITNALEDSETAYAAEALVRGHDTTYSYVSNPLNGTYPDGDTASPLVKKGEVVSLATQELANGGRVFAAGTVFMSDYELQAEELDNVWDVSYANRTIIENIVDSLAAELPLSSIADARKGDFNDYFRVQGTVTAGTAQKSNSFFDSIYIQDETGGINIFPYAAEGLSVGAKVEVVGYLSQYQGDVQIQLVQSKILDNENLEPINPQLMSAKDAMDYGKNGGRLIQVEGTVVEVEQEGDKVSQIRVRDDKGDIATVFIDGYIYSSTTGENTLGTFVKSGNKISAVGLLYKHPEGDSEESVPCLRVRDCDEILLISKVPTQEDQTITVTSDRYSKTYGDAAFDLSAKTNGDGALSYNTSNASVCTVNSTGRVTITGAGAATIKITAEATANYKAAAKTVSITVSQKAAAITLGQGSYTKTFGEKAFDITASTDGGALSYKSSNEKVCKVSNTGKVTITGAGTAKITITAKANTNYKAVSKDVTITVKQLAATISAKASHTKTLGGKAFSLSAKTNGDGKLSYKTSSSKICTVSSAGKVTIKGTGKAAITITAAKTTNCKSATKKVTITVKPKKVSLSKATSTKTKTLTATWKKASDVTGYEIQTATNKGFTKNKKTTAVTKSGTISKTISKLKKGTTYYVRVRAYKKSGSSKIYGAYSNVRQVKVK